MTKWKTIIFSRAKIFSDVLPLNLQRKSTTEMMSKMAGKSLLNAS